jgi:hypothetical protein
MDRNLQGRKSNYQPADLPTVATNAPVNITRAATALLAFNQYKSVQPSQNVPIAVIASLAFAALT